MNTVLDIKIKKRNIFVIALILLFITLSAPAIIRLRAGNDAFIGSEPYYHFRAAKELSKTGSYNMFNAPDDIVDKTYTPRNYHFTPYHFLLLGVTKAISLTTAIRILPFILGLLSLLVFNLILRQLIKEKYKRHIILVLLVMNPAFIYTFTIANPHSLAVLLTLLGFWLFMKSDRISVLTSFVCFSLLPLFSLFNALLALALLVTYYVKHKKRRNNLILITVLMAVIALANRVSLFYNYTYEPNMNIFSNIFSDLGGVMGFGIFTLILATYGVFANWKHKSSFFQYFMIAVMLLVLMIFLGNFINIYLVYFIVVTAGIGFVELYDRKWSAAPLKHLAVLIILCGIIFSATSYMTRLSKMGPDNAIVESLEWLGDNTFKDEFVLSHNKDGYMISTIARNPVLADSFASSEYSQRFLYKVQDSLFYERKLVGTKHLLELYNIKYIYITPEMKSGLVWSKENEGLLFLLTNRKTFNKIYDNDGIEIWEVINNTIE